MGFNITIDHATTANNSSQSGSSVTDDESSSGTGNTGVQVHSPTSAVGSHERDEYSDSVEEDNSWNHIYADDIHPSDSASRPRTSNQRRPIVEAPEPERPQPRRRQSSRRQIAHDRLPHHPHPRTRAPPPPPTAPESVESFEEWPQAPGAFVRTRPTHDGHVYWAPVPGNPPHGYAQSFSTGAAYSPYQTGGPAIGQQLVPFGSPSFGQSPYQNAVGGAAHGYFPPAPHGAPPMGNPMIPPHGGSPYTTGQELMHRTPNASYFPYPQSFPMHQPMPQPMVAPAVFPTYVYSPQPTPAPVSAPAPTTTPAPAPAASTPATQPTPPPAAESPKHEEQFARLEKILMDERIDREAREAAAKQAAEDAAAKAAADKKISDDIAAASSAAAAAATEEAEKKGQEALAKAKEEAEAAAAKAKEEADAAAKAAAEAAVPAAPPPPPEEKKKPIKFKDAVGRKFSFPFHLCNTWMGMEDLIRQAFLHVEVIGPHVAEGHYDLVGPGGDIILPQVWETVVEPDWTITMHMWPMPEPPPPEEVPPEAVVDVPPAPPPDEGVPPPPPEAPSAPSGAVVDPAGGKPPKKTTRSRKGGLSGWLAAGSKPKPKPKAAKKPAAG